MALTLSENSEWISSFDHPQGPQSHQDPQSRNLNLPQRPSRQTRPNRNHLVQLVSSQPKEKRLFHCQRK